MKHLKRFTFKTYPNSGISLFNVGRNEDCFLVDYKSDKRITIQDNVKEYKIQDVSNDGVNAVITGVSYAKKDRFLKIYEIGSQKLVFETNGREFFVYDVLFSPNPNMIIVRADIKSSTKAFIYDIEDKKIIYTFPKGEPLEYGAVDFKNQIFVYPNFRKKNEYIVFDFDTLEEKVKTLNCNAKIERIASVDTDSFFVIDSNFYAYLIKQDEVIWKRKLEFDDFHYAPGFFILKDSIVFDSKPFCSDILFSLDIKTGDLKESKTPVHLGMIQPYFDNLVMDTVGTIFDLESESFSHFDINKYL